MPPKLFCAILEQNPRNLRRRRAPLLSNPFDYSVRVSIDPRRNRFPGLSFCLGHRLPPLDLMETMKPRHATHRSNVLA
jgi:hypothetical protein